MKPLRLYTVRQMVAASIVGSPSMSAVLFAVNDLKLGRRERAVWVALGAISFTVLYYAIFIQLGLGERVGWAGHFGLVLVTWLFASRYQGAAIGQAMAAGAVKRSGWSVFAIWLAELLLVVTIVYPVVRRRMDNAHPSVVVSGTRIFYDPPATADDARRIGEFLDEKVKGGLGVYRIKVDRVGAGWGLSFLGTGIGDRAFGHVAELVSTEVLGGAPVKVQVCGRLDFTHCRALP